jgi:hypothetical protein
MASLLLCLTCFLLGLGFLNGYRADRSRQGGPFAAFWRGFVYICVGSLFAAAFIAFSHFGVALMLACVPLGLILMLWLLTTGTRQRH